MVASARRSADGTPLVPGHNVDKVDVAAGVARAAQLGYDTREYRMVTEYALMRHARGEEDGAERSALSGGISLTSWRVILAEAVTAAKYPEHRKLSAFKDQTQAIGEFLEWLGSQGIHRMSWREDLTDSRVTDPVCWERKAEWRKGTDLKLECNPGPGDAIRSDGVRGNAHCMHWQDPERPADSAAQRGTCCHCGKGQHYEVTVAGWYQDPRTIETLLAEFTGIDQSKLEAEKRQMLAAQRALNEAAR